ncbi:MAG: tRNA 2-selenouridine(34) synthase MnmH [Parvularculaceae bacterium]|nr:tRNA 2-selenouridine(34) synthase MnmH [Parvularculaceae bacterium]
MIEEVADLSPQALARFDAIIDVRSPAEFAEDRIPGAINLPVLSNEERAEVGTIYLRKSRFLARRIGAAFVARNVAAHLETALADRGAKFRPLLYCWRGGMRSNAMATILAQIGWRVGVLKGGYRTWRRAVVAALADDPVPLSLILIDGETGTAKTEILRRLSALGVQTIDLEGLAAHKGSVFGAELSRAQPTQKLFESALFDRLRTLDPARPIAVEAESSRIGRLVLPKRILTAMRAAPRIIIEAPAAARADYLTRAYRDLIETPGAVERAIDRLRPFHSKETIGGWLTLATDGRHHDLAAALMRDHYDPLYARSRKRAESAPAATLKARDLSDEGLDAAARAAAETITRLSRRSSP